MSLPLPFSKSLPFWVSFPLPFSKSLPLPFSTSLPLPLSTFPLPFSMSVAADWSAPSLPMPFWFMLAMEPSFPFAVLPLWVMATCPSPPLAAAMARSESSEFLLAVRSSLPFLPKPGGSNPTVNHIYQFLLWMDTWIWLTLEKKQGPYLLMANRHALDAQRDQQRTKLIRQAFAFEVDQEPAWRHKG